MNKLICYVGCIGGGKDYQAKKYIAEHPKTKHINFADELREMSWDILGWRPNTNEEYEDFKKLSLISNEEVSRIEFTGREYLQRLGTEALRKRDPNFWVKCWVNKVQEALNNGYDVVCSDCRFENELRFAIGINYSANLHTPASPYFVFCNYISDRYDCTNEHESEKLAQQFLRDGFQDQQSIDIDYIRNMMCNCVDLS